MLARFVDGGGRYLRTAQATSPWWTRASAMCAVTFASPHSLSVDCARSHASFSTLTK